MSKSFEIDRLEREIAALEKSTQGLYSNMFSKQRQKLEKELNQLKAEENDLSLELEMKNDVNLLRTRATDELGMIRKEYVEANYLDTRGNDAIEAYEEEDKENVGIAAILSAFGLAD